MCMFQKHAQWSQAGEVAKRLKPRLPAPPMAGTWTQILRLTCVSQRAVPICQSYFVLYNSASHFVKLRVAAGPLTEEELKAMLPGQHKFEFNFLETNVRSFFCFFCFTFRICRSCFATFPSSRGRAHSCSASQSWHLSDFSAGNESSNRFSTTFFRSLLNDVKREACGLFLH